MWTHSKILAAVVLAMLVTVPAGAQDGTSLAEQIREAEARLQQLRETRRAELLAELEALDRAEAEESNSSVAAPPSPVHATATVDEFRIAERNEDLETLTEEVSDRIDENEKARAAREFGGIEFGAGISLTLDNGDNDRVSAAVLDPNGIVRVTDENNDIARLMLESHYFFKPEFDLLGLEPQMWGIGPFIALQPGEGDNIIDAIALGLMLGFRYDSRSTESFNLGVGYVIDPNVRILGEGIVNGEPLPDGETEIRFRETSQHGWLILASFGF